MLPEPDAAGKKHSAKLCARIRERILRARGWIGFDEFMFDALYAPMLGFYASGRARFDESGDFITAPQLGKITAQCLAAQCADVLAETGGDVLEFGGGGGQLAADILAAMENLSTSDESIARAKYFIVETSEALRARQLKTLNQHGFAARAQWLSKTPENFRGVVIANEVLDAMPVICFETDARGRACHLGVGLDDGGNFIWARGEELPARLQQRLKTCGVLDAGENYRGEINLRGENWMRELGARMDAGAVLLPDYGFPRRELYHAERRGGTLMCHYRHRAHADPFFYPGLQDITAHVDFTAMNDAARDGGLTLAGFASQGAFLLSLGALDILAQAQSETASTRARIALSREVQTLTMPQEMGELFKVIAFTKNYAPNLRGFAMHDRRGRL